jgi:predicted TIM-barrel fold metal-dependent hydrolase
VTGLIDHWCNGFTPECRAEWEKGLSGAAINYRDEVAAAFKPAAEFVADMDRTGVRAVLVPAVHERVHDGHSPFSDVEPPVEAVVALASQFPGRVLGLYSIDPGNATKGVRVLERCVREYGFVGAQIHTHSWGRRLDDRDYYPYYAKCEELGVPVVMQVGHSASRAPSEQGRPFTADRPAIYFEDLTFVLSHTGWPWVDEAIAMAWKHPNVYLGTATHQPKHWDPALKDFAVGRGRHKVMVATGFPVLRHAQVIEQVHQLTDRDDVRAAILHDNAATVFHLS